jgi:hypothetical protein
MRWRRGASPWRPSPARAPPEGEEPPFVASAEQLEGIRALDRAALRGAMSDEEKLALDEQFYDICVNAGDTKALFDLLMKGADGAFCTKTEPMGPGNTEISALYFCSANAMWAAVPMVLAAGRRQGQAVQRSWTSTFGEEGKIWSGYEQAQNMITQVAAEQEMIDSGMAEPHWRTLQAYEGKTEW